MKPSKVKIIQIWIEKDIHQQIEVYGLGDDSLVYYYDDDIRGWIYFVNV